MNAIILENEKFQDLIEDIGEIKKSIGKNSNSIIGGFIDNQEFLELMKISKRTAQNWRDKEVISFSQVGNKIYYKLSDIEKLLKKNYNKSF